jgi:hypothetical protein
MAWPGCVMWNASNLKRRTGDAFTDRVRGYVGRLDLLDLALAICMELHREEAEFDLLSRDEAEGVRGRVVLDRCETLQFDLEAVQQAMSSEMRRKLDESVERLPMPVELAHRT